MFVISLNHKKMSPIVANLIAVNSKFLRKICISQFHLENNMHYAKVNFDGKKCILQKEMKYRNSLK